MRKTYMVLGYVWIALTCIHSLHAQTCGPEPVIDESTFEGSAFFNYGSIARAKSNSYKTAAAVGQILVGYTEGLQNNTTLGFFARYYLPPFALKVKATQGDLLDRIQVTWEVDALGPSASDGFNIYRDGIFLASVEPNIRSFNDFNVIAGRPYNYCVRGVNIFGEGINSCALGFQVPNGVVTGWIASVNGSPIPGATVTLTPMQGFSARFKDGDGALVVADSLHPFLPPVGSDWTMTFWIKTDTAGATPGKLIGMPGLYIRSRPNTGGQNGIAIATTPGGAALLAINFPSHPDDWHHVALSFDGIGNKARLYFDGSLVGTANLPPVTSPEELDLGKLAGSGYWEGRLDELRIYHHKLDELDFDQVMEGTASSGTPYLTHYWKFDEELGVKSYDIVHRNILYLCGATFDSDRPDVHTAGITNEDGYYRIESASYGTGTTFLAEPRKNFYKHRSLKFNKAENDYATFPDFAITPKATIEFWVNHGDPSGFQCILSKQFGGIEFRVVLDEVNGGLDDSINVHFNGTTKGYGLLGSGFKHLAFTWDSLSHTIKGYKNGQPIGTFTFPSLDDDWSEAGQPWYLGRRPGGENPFDGLIDEVAVYDTTLSQATILSHFQNERNPQEKGLRVYFPMDEGSGNKITNAGSLLLPAGATSGTEWNALAAHQVVSPHEFAPSTRQVTLNPSVTSVDQVDFTDRSTIPVTGYVRYSNTDCFAGNVEILVNGLSFSPPILTDSTGKFTIDFDPGATATLKPKYENHVFTPAFWDVTNVSSPIAGIVFNDNATHKITGKVKGGLCLKNITPPAAECIVEVSSADGCFSRTVTLGNGGTFNFNNLPPFEKMQLAIIKHNDPAIKTAFDNQGGYIVDISDRDVDTNFIYIAPPQVVIVSGLTPLPNCGQIVLDQDEPVHLKVKLQEVYFGGTCDIDTAEFHIANGFGDAVLDTVMGNSLLEYNFHVGSPNPSYPFNKTLQIIGKKISDDVEGQLTVSAIITGIKSHENTFTTLLPEIPSLILRDPPGDGSYSYLEKNEKFCTTTSLVNELETGGGGGVKLFVGGKNEWIVAPLGLGFIIDIAGDSWIGTDASVLYTKVNTNSFETCTSFSSRISTNDDDLIVGGERGGDLYMGTAMNIVYGNVDIITFDTMNCVGQDDTGVMIQPGDYATTFIYSEFYILNTLIPSLENLATSAGTSPEDKARYEESIDRWNAIVALNREQKDNARFIKNISFDAGIQYEYAETSDTTTTQEIESSLSEEFTLATEFKFTVLEIGIGGNARFVNNTTSSGKDETGKSTGVTTGYVFNDDDPLDAFSVDVGMDSVYKTPVFNLKAGQSSCPWEPGTANREGTNLAMFPGFSPSVINVPANEAAVFKFNLGNTSATHEDWTYSFTSIAADNPDGAVIKLNGRVLNDLQQYIIPYGTSQTVTLTVERGPIEYIYDHLRVAEISACEYDRNLALSIPIDADSNFFSGIELSVHFIRPCSEVNMTSPRQNWVIFPDPDTGPGVDDNKLGITVSGYDLQPSSFEGIRVQYRRADGNGAWINIPGIYELFNPNWSNIQTSNPKLGPVYSTFEWHTDGLEDGEYEIRALAVCGNTIPNENGFSEIIKGRIDREPPSIVGLPQPSDHFYQAGDEISFTFNQPVNCADLNEVDNVQLFYSESGLPIDIHATCVDNKIVITPTIQNSFLENKLLRAELHGIKDLTGNEFNGTVQNLGIWEFYVDRNELAWLTDSSGIVKYEDEEKSVTVKIHNRGGSPVPFQIQNVPGWVHVAPDQGTLVPNEIREIQFTAPDTMDLGWFTQDIILHTDNGQNTVLMGGDEHLPFSVRNLCRPPAWNIDPASFQFSMTLITRLRFNNVFSSDPEDLVAAFIDGQLRGMTKPVYVPSTNTWVAFLTIYGNAADIGKLITYEIFDASTCLRYAGNFANAPFNFTVDGTQGSPANPRVLSDNGTLVDDLPLVKGWNWISFNLHFPDSAINMALKLVTNATGDLIKNQNAFSVYSNNTWSGSLSALGNTSMYMYQANQPNTIKVTGTALTPATLPISVVTGWNWIGYIPTYKLTVNAALASLPASTGNVIKSQTQFAQYVSSTAGWVGNLKYLEPHHGYLLRMDSPGSITYPPQPLHGEDPAYERSLEEVSTYWQIDPTDFESSMTLIGIFQYDQTNATSGEMELGAFVNGEIRGVADAIYIDYLEAWMFFMTCYANTSGEQIQFKLFDRATGEINDLQEKMVFLPNYHQGSIEEPIPFTLQTTGLHEIQEAIYFSVQPNPFNAETECRFVLPAAQEIALSICDLNGQLMYTTQIHADAGLNKLAWKGCTSSGTPLGSGVYILQLKTDQGMITQKVVLQR